MSKTSILLAHGFESFFFYKTFCFEHFALITDCIVSQLATIKNNQFKLVSSCNAEYGNKNYNYSSRRFR